MSVPARGGCKHVKTELGDQCAVAIFDLSIIVSGNFPRLSGLAIRANKYCIFLHCFDCTDRFQGCSKESTPSSTKFRTAL